MNRILKITFKNAKLFPFNRNGKDFVSDQNIRTKRNEQLMFKEPITVHQISNMLHKMMGERPVPSFRFVGYKRQEDIFNLAQNSYLKINSIKKNDVFIKELIQIKKSVNNGWNKNPNIFWAKIKIMMGEYFDDFIDKFGIILGFNPLEKPFLFYSKIGLNDEKYNELIIWISSVGKTPIGNFLVKENFVLSEITTNSKIGETTVRGISNINSLSGEIFVPISDKQLSRFVYNTATILDGGLAEIDNVYYDVDISNDDLDNTRLISDISDEKGEKVVW